MNKSSIKLINELDYKPSAARLDLIVHQLQKLDVEYVIQDYSTGMNLIVDLGHGNRRIGVSSHFDRVPGSGGANDNGSAIVVCLEIIRRYHLEQSATPLRVFFFDEEENGLLGSNAYVSQFGISDMESLINMELVGVGDQFALWPVSKNKSTPTLARFERAADGLNVATTRFDQIVTNSADHLPFLKAGLDDSFTITCISDEDLKIAASYYAALRAGKPLDVLQEIIFSAPTFANYHRRSDTADKLDLRALQSTANCIWNTINNLGI